MPPKYSTRRHKYKNKNAKSNKKYKQRRATGQGQIQRRKYIERPDEITFNDAERIEFVTGFAKRKQQRRIRAAKDLVSIQHEQHIELRNERREKEIEYLVKGGHINDPLIDFLQEEEESMSENDINDINDIKYENNDMITNVSVCNIEVISISEGNMDWIHDDENHEMDKESKLSVYEQRKETKREVEGKESKKKYRRKVKKMLKFVKEFNRNKKRKANAKHRKKKPKKQK